MKTEDIIQQYVDAYGLGFVENFRLNSPDCGDAPECDDCPAAEACEYLSEKGHFDIFKANFEKLNLQELIEDEIDKQEV